jgi:RNA polymerase sigma factor (sigma-70 family)
MAGGVEEDCDRAQRGDREAFGRIMRPLMVRSQRLAMSLLDDAGEAEDAVQDATLKAWQMLVYLRDPGALESWFLKIVGNRCREVRRTRRWTTPGVGLGEHAVAGIEDRVVAGEDLRRALASLSHEHRLVLSLHFYLDLALEEVAAVLGVPVGTAKSRLHRALQNVRPLLAPGTAASE